MRKGGGKQKGGSFERKMCRLISEFWSNGVYHDLCWRSAGSGAKGTVTRTKTKGHSSDITSVSPLIDPLIDLFAIELKHYKEFDIAETLRGIKGNKLFAFWRQAVRSAIQSDRIPVLIVKPNSLPELLIVRAVDAEKFVFTMKKLIRFMSVGSKLWIFRLDDFIQFVNKDKFNKLVRVMAEER